MDALEQLADGIEQAEARMNLAYAAYLRARDDADKLRAQHAALKAAEVAALRTHTRHGGRL